MTSNTAPQDSSPLDSWQDLLHTNHLFWEWNGIYSYLEKVKEYILQKFGLAESLNFRKTFWVSANRSLDQNSVLLERKKVHGGFVFLKSVTNRLRLAVAGAQGDAISATHMTCGSATQLILCTRHVISLCDKPTMACATEKQIVLPDFNQFSWNFLHISICQCNLVTGELQNNSYIMEQEKCTRRYSGNWNMVDSNQQTRLVCRIRKNGCLFAWADIPHTA